MSRGVTSIREYACTRVLRLLDSYLASELSVETNHEILDHVERCPSCTEELRAREKLRDAVRRAGARLASDPSPELEAKVRALIARAPPPRRLPQAPFALVAAALLCGVAALVMSSRGLLRQGGGGNGSILSRNVDLAAFHAAARTQKSCALRVEWKRGEASVQALSSALGMPFAAALAPIADRLPGYEIVAAHRCAHGGREVVHLVLAKRGESGPGSIASVIVMPKRGALPPAPMLAEERVVKDGREVRYALTGRAEEGFEVVGLETDGSALFVVSSRGKRENLDLSRAVLPALVTATVAR